MADHENPHYVQHYVRIWGILVVLLIVSILGPRVGIEAVTLITAFGVALVKAYLVAKNFMHLNVQPGYVGYLLSTCLVFMLLFFSGSSPDVMKKEGAHWVKPAVVVKGPLEHHAGHSAGHGDHGAGHHEGGGEGHGGH